MPSHAHEQAIRFIQTDPSLLLELLRRLTGKAAPGPLTRLDSALRGSAPLEVHPI